MFPRTPPLLYKATLPICPLFSTPSVSYTNTYGAPLSLPYKHHALTFRMWSMMIINSVCSAKCYHHLSFNLLIQIPIRWISISTLQHPSRRHARTLIETQAHTQAFAFAYTHTHKETHTRMHRDETHTHTRRTRSNMHTNTHRDAYKHV